MARVAIWLKVGDPPRTLGSFNWTYLGPYEKDPSGKTASFKVGDGYWSGEKGDTLHGIKVEKVEKGRVEVSY